MVKLGFCLLLGFQNQNNIVFRDIYIHGDTKNKSKKMSNTSQVVIISGRKGYHAIGKRCLKGAAIVPFLKLGHGHMVGYSLYYIIATGHFFLYLRIHFAILKNYLSHRLYYKFHRIGIICLCYPPKQP